LLEANGGREIFGSDGRFEFPPGVKRVWIDVGAHYLETTRDQLALHDDLAIIAIEPLSECWSHWPRTELEAARTLRDLEVQRKTAARSARKRKADEAPEAGSVADGATVLTTKHTIASPGPQVLKIWALDPGLVFQKLVIDTGGLEPSYLGPPESPRLPPASQGR
jgi:hypothetical protein